MDVIFTDIDGVLNFVHKNEWNRTARIIWCGFVQDKSGYNDH